MIIEVSRFTYRTPAERVRDYLLICADLAEVPPTPAAVALALHMPLSAVHLALGELEVCGVIERRYTLRRSGPPTAGQ